ncbi:hypothetical protein LX66_2842 [Chitinophaga japonensis]|uniref:Uncharacterized protein n=1 Tax=Chitinophaga japonensis TaxID=104662 RepID=A0A562T6P3_CHIJA|nr:hypothetical protein LX66_2842 [Chitinophaga japonensis]
MDITEALQNYNKSITAGFSFFFTRIFASTNYYGKINEKGTGH